MNDATENEAPREPLLDSPVTTPTVRTRSAGCFTPKLLDWDLAQDLPLFERPPNKV